MPTYRTSLELWKYKLANNPNSTLAKSKIKKLERVIEIEKVRKELDKLLKEKMKKLA